MVRILANGDIVQDDDPRVRNNASRNNNYNRRTATTSNQYDHHEADGNGPQYMEQQGPTIFDTWNGKLLQLGIPRWNVGDHVVEPLMTVIMLLVLLFFGLQGVLFLGLLYFVVKMSQRSTQQAPANNNQRGPGRFSQGFGSGHRLGR